MKAPTFDGLMEIVKKATRKGDHATANAAADLMLTLPDSTAPQGNYKTAKLK